MPQKDTTPATTPQPSSRPPKPEITPIPSSDLLSRLNAFLPAISAANRDLESEIAAGMIEARNIENVDENSDAYIEMNLGLGVLKQVQPGESESESDSETEEGEEGEEEGEEGVLVKLMGGRARREKGSSGKPGIQVVEEDAGGAHRMVDTKMEDGKEAPKTS